MNVCVVKHKNLTLTVMFHWKPNMGGLDEDLARTVSSEVSRTEHVFVTNEDEISPKEAIAKLNKSLEERLDKMMKIKEAMRAIICAQKTRQNKEIPQGQIRLAKPVIHRRTWPRGSPRDTRRYANLKMIK